jgi:hypothetical protein
MFAWRDKIYLIGGDVHPALVLNAANFFSEPSAAYPESNNRESGKSPTRYTAHFRTDQLSVERPRKFLQWLRFNF